MSKKKKEVPWPCQTVLYPRKDVKMGDYFLNVMPFSEVCMHLRVAGRIMGVKLVGHTYTGTDKVNYTPSAQLVNPLDGREYSFPISLGEAGVFSEQVPGLKEGCRKYYCYECPQIGVIGECHVS